MNAIQELPPAGSDDFRPRAAAGQGVTCPAGSWQAQLLAEIEQASREARVGQGSICVISVMVGGGPVRWVVGHPPRRPR